MNAADSHGQRRLACLAVRSRYSIAVRLLDGPLCVSELARAVGLSQSCTTRHLQAMSSAGLVAGARAGKRVNFRLRADDPAAADLLRAALGAGGHLAGSPGPAPPRSVRVEPRPRAHRPPPAVVPASEEPPSADPPVRADREELEDYLL